MNQRDLDCRFHMPGSVAACSLLDILVYVPWSNVHEILSSRIENPWNDAVIRDEVKLIALVHIESPQRTHRAQRMTCIVRIVILCALTFLRTALNGSRCSCAFHWNVLEPLVIDCSVAPFSEFKRWNGNRSNDKFARLFRFV